MSEKRNITFTLNGEQVEASIRPHVNLVELLQNEFSLTGARESCGQGMCGCCTVIVDGVAVSGCLYLAVLVDGTKVETVEGLGDGPTLDPLQDAFIESGAFQCGYCTSGMLLMCKQLLATYPDPTDQQIKHYLSGNLCRCATYPEVIKAVKLVASRSAAKKAA